jgi:hypothetical protein
MARNASAASEIVVPSSPQISDTTISSSFGVLFAPIASSAPSPQLPILSSCVLASDTMISGKCGLDAALLRVQCRNLLRLSHEYFLTARSPLHGGPTRWQAMVLRLSPYSHKGPFVSMMRCNLETAFSGVVSGTGANFPLSSAPSPTVKRVFPFCCSTPLLCT